MSSFTSQFKIAKSKKKTNLYDYPLEYLTRFVFDQHKKYIVVNIIIKKTIR